jgi:4-amino-4-deoxy-L-arabinose transferase-like glycosyltransferase
MTLPLPRAAIGGLALVSGLAALLLVPDLGVMPLERAEVYFLDGARSMVERGDDLVPYYRGEPFFDKPILTYWLIAHAFRALGFSAEAGRVVSVLAAFGAIASGAWLGWRLLGAASALAGSLVLTTTVAFIGFGRVAMSDMLLALWSTMAVAFAVEAVRAPAAWWPLPAVGAALGLGFATKGPIALALPGIALLLLLAWHWPPRGVFRAGRIAAAGALFGVIGLAWFVAVYLRLGAEPLEYFFLHENLERFAGSTYDAGHGPSFYVLTFLAQAAPWSLFVPLAAWAFFWRWRHLPGASEARLLLAWVAIAFLPLSASRGKVDYYLLPLYPPAAMAVGHLFAAVPWGALERAWARFVLLAGALGLAVLVWAPTPLPVGWLPGPTARLGLGALCLALALVLALSALRPRPQLILGALVATVASVFFATTTVLLPAFFGGQPTRAIVEDVGRELRYRPDATFVLCEDPLRVQREVLFELRRSVDQRCDLWSLAASRHPFLFLLRQSEQPSLGALPAIREVSSHSYLHPTAMSLSGLLRRPSPSRLFLVANYTTTDPEAERKRKRAMRREIRAWEAAIARGEAPWPEPD